MAMVRGGDIRQLTIDGREYSPAPQSSVTLVRSGFTNTSAPTGNGGMHTTQSRKLGGFSGLTISIDPDTQDVANLQAVADNWRATPVTITLATGETWIGELQVEGDVSYNGRGGTVSISMRGVQFAPV